MFLVEQIADTKPLRPGCFPCVWGAEEASVERLKLVSKEDGRKGRQDQIMKDPMGHGKGFQFHSALRVK